MKSIFIVEDEAVVALELKDHLRTLGYNVCGHAARGEAALRQIPEARPDLVIIDINLGRGLTGLDVAEQLKKVIDVPVIFLTAYSDAALTEQASKTGSSAYLVKPFEPRVLRVNIELSLMLHAVTTALRESEARFAAVFEFAPDAILIANEGGRVVMANRKADETFGYSRDELLRLTTEELVPQAARPRHATLCKAFMAEDRARGMGSGRSRVEALRKDGTTIQVEISLSPVHLQGGPLVVAAIRDITARVRMEEERALLEEQLRQAQKMKSLGTLAGGIAHDFNNLLTVILGNVEIARGYVDPTDPVAESLDAIAIASSRAGELIKQILAFSRQRPTRRALASILAVFDEVTRMLRATLPTSIQIITDVGGDLPKVLIDPTQIHQMLMNLGTNAWHAIKHESGTITFRVRGLSVEDGAQPAAGMAPGRYLRIQVSDDGEGMSAETVQRIFDPFFTTKEIGRGTGLGLAVVHGVVTDHGGVITVESALGRGTTFSVYLPEAAAHPSPPSPPERQAHQGDGHVLVLDDEELVGRVVKRIVEGLGYQVTLFTRAADAIEAVRADPHRFDVVITDHLMPEMSGIDVAGALAAIRPELPILLASGYRSQTDDEHLTANIKGHLDKPYSRESLSQALNAITTGLKA